MSFYIYNKAIGFNLPDNFRLKKSDNKDDVCGYYITKKTKTEEGLPYEQVIGKITEIEVSFNNNELDLYREVFVAIANYYKGSKYCITPSPCECLIINTPLFIEDSNNNSGIIIIVPAGEREMACILISGAFDSDNVIEEYNNALVVAKALTVNQNIMPISDITSDAFKMVLELSFDEEASIDVSNDLFSPKADSEKPIESNTKYCENDKKDNLPADNYTDSTSSINRDTAKKREKVRIELVDAKLELSHAEKKVESNNETIKTDEASLEEKRKVFADYIDSNMADLEYNKSHITSEQIKQRTLIKELENKKSEMEMILKETKKDLEGISFFKFSLKKELSNRVEALDSQIKECNDSLIKEKTKLDDLDTEFKTKVLLPQQKIDEMEKDLDALIERINRLTASNNSLSKIIENKRETVTALDNELKSLLR